MKNISIFILIFKYFLIRKGVDILNEKNFEKYKKNDEITWFGFRLTQNQALIMFIFGLFGVIFFSLLFFYSVFSIITFILFPPSHPSFILFPPSHPSQIIYYYLWLISTIPANTIYIVFLILCVYTIKKCKQKNNS